MNDMDMRWGWLAAACVSIVAAMCALWPDFSPPFRYDDVHLQRSDVHAGEVVPLCVKGTWVSVPVSGEAKLHTVCGDGLPLATEFYPVDLSGPRAGAMVVDKCADGGKPRPFEIRCKVPGPFIVTAENTFKRRMWYGLHYETTHPAYTIHGTILLPER